ncbi:MAG: hypothetical protein QJT81_09540 [Candidatus Thiothrix putei]|uniref:PqqD family peptide modification chaperone n=1 Tax=Candidatus Thiothrix putei TaxID=3080811 RepID=A0AA95KQ01_9GAMM|nr:MAG: hypothetical protein QJT81_09540 [Candidatus Thiothrix putei]
MNTASLFVQSLCHGDTQFLFQRMGDALHVPDKATFMIWEALQAGIAASDIAAALAEANPAADCQRDVAALQAQWVQLGLLGVAQPATDTPHFSHYFQPALDTVCVTTNQQALHDYLQTLYPGVVPPPPSVGTAHLHIAFDPAQATYTLWQDGQHQADCPSFDDAVITAVFLIGEIATHEEPRLLVCHAAAVQCQGAAVLMPAAAGKGKSTLTAMLLQHGCQLINDDIVPVNHDGSITAIQQPLKIKSGAWEVLSKHYPALHTYPAHTRSDGQQMKHLPLSNGRCAAGERLWVSLMVVPEYRQGQAGITTQALSETEKLQHFITAQPFFTHPLTRPYLQRVLSWLAAIPAYRVVYSDGAAAVALIETLILQTHLPKDTA